MMAIYVSEEEVAQAVLQDELDICALLTVLLRNEDDLDRLCRHVSSNSTASIAECEVPGRLRFLADALEQSQSEDD